jgi:hypothetical protein
MVAVLMLLATCFVGCATAQQFTNNDSNMCMNVVNHGSPEPGAVVNLKGCDPWQNQKWSFNGNGPITGVGGFCIDVQGGAPVDGAAVIYTPCVGAPSQNWTTRNGAIIGIGGKCLDLKGGELCGTGTVGHQYLQWLTGPALGFALSQGVKRCVRVETFLSAWEP